MVNEEVYSTLKSVFGSKISEIIVTDKGRVYDTVMEATEKLTIEMVLQETNRNQVKASERLGISRNNLREKIKKYNLF